MRTIAPALLGGDGRGPPVPPTGDVDAGSGVVSTWKAGACVRAWRAAAGMCAAWQRASRRHAVTRVEQPDRGRAIATGRRSTELGESARRKAITSSDGRDAPA